MGRSQKKTYRLAALLAITVATLSSPCLAGSVNKAAQFKASAVVLKHIRAQVSVSNHSKSDIKVHWSGPKEWAEALKPAEKNGTLIINGKDLPQTNGSNTVVHAENVTVTATGGGTASVTIGNNSITASEKAPSIDVMVPKSVDLTVTDLVGTASIAPRTTPVTASVRSGSILFEDLQTGGQLSIPGSGNIVVEDAKGDMDISIPGSGDITLEKGALKALKAEITGNGIINVNGVSNTASLSIPGAGMINVEKINKKPAKSVTGAGMISVGNW